MIQKTCNQFVLYSSQVNKCLYFSLSGSASVVINYLLYYSKSQRVEKQYMYMYVLVIVKVNMEKHI